MNNDLILDRLRKLAGLPPSNQTSQTNQGDNNFNPVTPDSPENFSPMSKKDESVEVEDLLIPLTKTKDQFGQSGVEIKPDNFNLNQEPRFQTDHPEKVSQEPEKFDPSSDAKIFVLNVNLSDFEDKPEDDEGLMTGDEVVDEDMGLNNGYHDQVKHDGLDYFDRWAPRGNATTPPSSLGPSAAKATDNPEFAGMKEESIQKIHESLVYEYRKEKKQISESGNQVAGDKRTLLSSISSIVNKLWEINDHGAASVEDKHDLTEYKRIEHALHNDQLMTAYEIWNNLDPEAQMYLSNIIDSGTMNRWKISKNY